MKRRDFLRGMLGVAGSVTMAGNTAARAGLAVGNATSRVRLGRRRPNVIYILADDLGYGDLGCYGQKKIRTPNLDRMAAEGMRFTQHYAGTTVCAPARCSLMTGLHTGHCHVRGNKGTNGYDLPIPDGTFTLAELFKRAGYVTGCFGKWGLGGPETEGHPNNQGFDEFFGYLGQGKAHFYWPAFLWHNAEQVVLDRQVYSHDLITDHALQFVHDHRDRPFFMYLPYTIPHAELRVPEDEIIQSYRALGWPETPYYGSHYGDQPTPHAAFAAMIARMDRDIGRLLSLLKTLGLEEDTVVMFSSDNGPHSEGGADPTFFNSRGGLRGKKRDLYEGGIRVPFIVRWPGRVRAGAVSDHISAFWDVLPTCAELIDVPAPADLDGVSFLPELLGRSQREHEYLYWEFHEQGGKQALRQGDWKAVRLNMKTVADPPVQLYNLRTDPTESTDVAAQHPAVAQRLKALMQQAHVPSSIFKFYGE